LLSCRCLTVSCPEYISQGILGFQPTPETVILSVVYCGIGKVGIGGQDRFQRVALAKTELGQGSFQSIKQASLGMTYACRTPFSVEVEPAGQRSECARQSDYGSNGCPHCESLDR
jgi:hypothetical protein